MLNIEIHDITKDFQSPHRGGAAVRAVDAACLTIRRGEIFFLLGPSGCGKTTLLRILAGFEHPTSGRVLFDGADVTTVPPEKRQLAMVFQSYALWPHMTVAGNVEFAPRMARQNRATRKSVVAEMLRVVGMTDRRHHKPAQLSGGQQQRVALARALAAAPKGLLFDEPLSNLDARLRVRMRGEIRRIIKDAGATAVYVTHDQEEALSMADRIAVMDDGRVVQVGTPEQVYHRPVNRFVADFLGEANFLAAMVEAAGESEVRLDTSAGQVRARGGGEAGRKVTCCIRPERVRLSSSGAAEENCLPATYRGRTYMGATCRHHLQLIDGSPFAALTVGASETVDPGMEARVFFSPDDVVILE
jgi:ABC-type Fe3+/spermidine/putrescine transport system ATPase subunit